MYRVACVSRLYIPSTVATPTTSLSKSQQLLQECGYIHKCSNGIYALLPLAFRVITKIEAIIREEMQNIGAMEVSLPCLASQDLWESCGRWREAGKELFRVEDRLGQSLCLQPTHEEAIAQIVATAGCGSQLLPAASFPLKLFQISDKFRDEMRPAAGLLRSRIFRMKDLYTFDVHEEGAMNTYEQVLEAYRRIFTARLALPSVHKVRAQSGLMGGTVSHEYHIPSQAGQDYIRIDENTKEGVNCELLEGNGDGSFEGTKIRTTEVAHSFFLGTKYSAPLKAFHNSKENANIPLQMCCFGIGVTRLLPAILDSMLQDGPQNQTSGLRWPTPIAPYKICFIPPKSGSKIPESVSKTVFELAETLNDHPNYKNDVIIDDKTDLTIGKRLLNAKRNGYPMIIVGGKSMQDNPAKLELIKMDKNNNYMQILLSPEELYQYLMNE